MFGKREVKLKLTAAAEEQLARWKLNSNLEVPILSIKWAKWHDEPTERWVLGFHERRNLREGWLGVTPDFEFVVVQEWILNSLDGKTLDIRGGLVFLE